MNQLLPSPLSVSYSHIFCEKWNEAGAAEREIALAPLTCPVAHQPTRAHNFQLGRKGGTEWDGWQPQWSPDPYNGKTGQMNLSIL